MNPHVYLSIKLYLKNRCPDTIGQKKAALYTTVLAVGEKNKTPPLKNQHASWET